MTTNPYEPSTVGNVPVVAEAWRDGDLVVVSQTGEFPSNCVFCNRGSSKRFTVRVLNQRPAGILLRIGQGIVHLGIWFLLMLAGYQLLQTPFARQFPHTGNILCFAIFGVFIAFVVPRLSWTMHPSIPLRFGICDRHSALRTTLGVATYLTLACLTLAYISKDAPVSELPWVPVVRKQLLRIGLLGTVGFPFAMLLFLGSLNPQVVKTDDSGRLWVGGIPKAFRQSLADLPDSE